MKQAKPGAKNPATSRQLSRFLNYKYPENSLSLIREVEKNRIQETRLELEYLRVAFNV